MASIETQIAGRTNHAGIHPATLAFEEAAEVLDLEPWIVQRLRHPLEESTYYLQIMRDSGEPVCVPLFAVHHNERSGCSAGSLALTPGLQLRDCQAVGRERAWQSALLGLPMGGASYGLVCDPTSWSERDLTSLIRPLSRQLHRQSGSQLVFPGRGCHREFLGRLSADLLYSHNVTVTGKPDSMGGLSHTEFAAEGIAAAISAALRHVGRPSIGARIAIQGFTELGQTLSQRLTREGMKVVAVSDTSGGIYRADGLIVADLNARLAREQVLFGYTEAEHISRADVINADADVLLLTSGANEVNETTCGKITAGIVVEGDYNAIDESARERLALRDALVLPWFVASAGTLVACYLEAHDIQILTKPQELLARTYTTVGQTVEAVLRHGSEMACSTEGAAYRLAVNAAANYMRSCGIPR